MIKQKGTVLVADDEEVIVDSIVRKLQDSGYDCVAASDGEQALREAFARDFNVALLDIKMPKMSGTAVLERITAERPDTCVVMLTAVSAVQTVVEAMKLGAYDYVTKPFDLNHMVSAVDRALERQRLVLQNREYRRILEETVEHQEGQIHQYVHEAIGALAREEVALQQPCSPAVIDEIGGVDEWFVQMGHTLSVMAEMREPYALGHSERVSMIATEIAMQVGCPSVLVRDIRLAGIVHDIGKIAVPDYILLKPGPLTPAEYSEVKRHPTTAIQILRHNGHFNGALFLVESHHEWYNGKGYPSRLKGDNIPLGARILAVADGYDALTSHRPHREGLSHQETIEALKKGAGSQWDPQVVEGFLRVLRREKKMLQAAVAVT